MKINESNKQRIHDVLISDLQRRTFKQYNERKDEFNITDELFSIYNEIAGQIKKLRGKSQKKIVPKTRGTLPKGYN